MTAAESADFDVRPSISSLIRDALDAQPSAETSQVVEAVVAAIDADEQEWYLRQAIALRVSAVASTMRASVTPAMRRGVSTKQTLIRDQYWPEFLRQRLVLSGGVKAMGEATAADLREAAAARQAQAADLLFRADQFLGLAELMDRARVKRLEQLDPAMGRIVVERAA